MKNAFVIIAIMTSGIVHASDVPFQKIVGEYKISACSGTAEGRMTDALQQLGNGVNPCDTFDAVTVSVNGLVGVISLHKSHDKINAELKAVEGKSLAEINAVLAHSGMFAAYGVGQSVSAPGIQTNYSETDSDLTFSSVTDIAGSKTSVRISFQTDSSGQRVMTIKDSLQYSDGQSSGLDLTGSISQ